MKEYIVSLNILTSSSATSEQLSEFLGIPDSMPIHRKIDRGLLWRIESDLEKQTPLNEHVNILISRLPSTISMCPNDFIQEIYLSIGVFHDSVTCTVSFPNECLKFVLSKCPKMAIEIACYPCEEESNNDDQ